MRKTLSYVCLDRTQNPNNLSPTTVVSRNPTINVAAIKDGNPAHEQKRSDPPNKSATGPTKRCYELVVIRRVKQVRNLTLHILNGPGEMIKQNLTCEILQTVNHGKQGGDIVPFLREALGERHAIDVR